MSNVYHKISVFFITSFEIQIPGLIMTKKRYKNRLRRTSLKKMLKFTSKCHNNKYLRSFNSSLLQDLGIVDQNIWKIIRDKKLCNKQFMFIQKKNRKVIKKKLCI